VPCPLGGDIKSRPCLVRASLAGLHRQLARRVHQVAAARRRNIGGNGFATCGSRSQLPRAWQTRSYSGVSDMRRAAHRSARATRQPAPNRRHPTGRGSAWWRAFSSGTVAYSTRRLGHTPSLSSDRRRLWLACRGGDHTERRSIVAAHRDCQKARLHFVTGKGVPASRRSPPRSR